MHFLSNMKYHTHYSLDSEKEKYATNMAPFDKLHDALEKGDYVIGILIDFLKVFNTVDRSILLYNHYGVRGPAYNWFCDYLNNKTQLVSFSNVHSQNKFVLCGVPQGSIIGPVLFLIRKNDRAYVSNQLFTVLFADGNNIFDTC